MSSTVGEQLESRSDDFAGSSLVSLLLQSSLAVSSTVLQLMRSDSGAQHFVLMNGGGYSKRTREGC